ncbi:hypothetical protein AURDEDRAFT_77456 [Auricularia subglabra TFB-10046 SS5]|uniref:DDE-1 domain-containing protein n=1 Tax=Auricularia subglabra (strain TFB-10046 / SS5) TaxID=717982 RepID=J0CR96_AURST|nr:hypothetical protein AURDEDRAFT_77456 [Auricularia subglabra TFB-10046 SS5]
MRAVFSHHLAWSYRTTTRASAKLPVNWPVLCTRMHGRATYHVRMNGIDDPDFVVNPDQAGCGLIPTGNKTWTEKGSKQVKGHAHDEKRQTTLVVTSTASGMMLPFHSIWGGSTDKSLPAANAPRRTEADALGFKYAHGDTRHWSSRETTKMVWAFVTHPSYADPFQWHNRVVGRQKLLLFLDCWPVHIAKKDSNDFLPWMRREYPYFLIVFIPGGCESQLTNPRLQCLIPLKVRASSSPPMSACSASLSI